jgi:hypothetical protein
MGDIEIYQKSQLMSAQSQIGQNLSEMNGEQFLHALDLDDEAVFDNEIDAVRARQLDAVMTA